MIFYVETDRGAGLSMARNLAAAEKEALREAGTEGFKLVREATKEDIEHVRAMGGWVPKGA